MRASILILTAVLTASPMLANAAAKAKADAAADDHAGPIPYSELAAADAKLNGPATKKHKVTHKKAAPAASTAATATAGADAKAAGK